MPTPKKNETRQAKTSEITSVFERATNTLAQMSILSEKWIWDHCSPAQFQEKMDLICGAPHLIEPPLQQLFTKAEMDELHNKGAFARALKQLHAATVTGLGVARVAWEAIPEAAEVISSLSAAGQVEEDIFDEAERWELAWHALDPAWVPLPESTLSTFTALIASTREARREWLRAIIRRQRAEVRLARAVRELDQLQKRWYSMATAIFDEDSVEGEGIRARIPTSYVPRYAAAAKRKRQLKREQESQPVEP